MQEAFSFAAAAPFIVLVVALVRYVVPGIEGRLVPALVLSLTVTWGLVLVGSGRFNGDVAEFVVTAAVTATAAMGLAGVASTFTREDSAINRVT